MLDSPSALQVLGLEIEANMLKGVLLHEVKGKPVLIRTIQSEILGAELPDEPTLPPEIYRILTPLLTKAIVGTALNTDEVLVRPLEVKLKKDPEIAAVIDFQAEPLLPYPIENAIIDWIKLETTADGSKLTILSARKDYIEKHLALWKSLKIEPEILASVPSALAIFASQFSAASGLQIVLHIGSKMTSCILADNGKLLAAQSVSRGMSQIVEALVKDRPAFLSEASSIASLDPSEVQQMPHLVEILDLFRIDVTRIVLALSKQVKGFETKEILVTGEIGLYPAIQHLICQDLNVNCLSPIENPNFLLTSQELQFYAIPIGVALTGLPEKQNQINFRQQQYTYPYPWRRLQKSLLLYFASCLFVAFALYCFASAYLSKESDLLRQDYANLLTSLHKSYPEFEAQYRKSAGLEPISAEADLNPKMLSLEDLSSRVAFLDKQVRTNPDTYPLFPNTPNVSDVLGWIANHPSFKPSLNAEGQTVPGLKLENFNYKMMKRPDKNKKNEAYQVKVELDFSAPTPTQAREFHDALIAPNAIVDPKGEIKWGTNRGLYHTSFFLKDKTLYPSSIK